MLKTKSKKISNSLITVTTDFDTGAGTDIKFINDNDLQLIVPSDPISNKYTIGYDYYFHVCIRNISSNFLDIGLKILRPDNKNETLEWLPSKAPIFCSDDEENWYLLSNVRASNSHRNYKLSINVGPGKKVKISNNIPVHPTCVDRFMDKIQKSHSDKTICHKIGNSVNNLPIKLLEIDESPDKKKDRFLIWAGIHPSEPDTIATFWIINWLLSNDPIASTAKKRFIFEIIPMINPDGFIIGTSGCNANGINLFWDFRMDDPIKSPESTSLWKWIKKRTPNISIDLHAYIYQVTKKRRPYIGKINNYPRELRKIAWSLNTALIDLADGQAVGGETVENKTSLGPQLINRFGTLTYPGYHFHFADGPEESKKFIIATISTIIFHTSRHGLLSEIQISRSSNWDYTKIYWVLKELLFDKLPRRLKLYLEKFHIMMNGGAKGRLAIDNVEAWSAYFYNKSERKPVAKISAKNIS